MLNVLLQRSVLVLSLTLFLASGCAVMRIGKPETLSINDFDSGVPFGSRGVYKTYASACSAINVEPSFARRFGGSGRSLVVDYDVKPGGYAGVLLALYAQPESDSDKEYLDASKYSKISFVMNAGKGLPVPAVRIADAGLMGREDSVSLGGCSRFAVTTLKEDWVVYDVPLSAVQADLKSLAGLILHFPAGKGSVCLDNVILSNADHQTLWPAGSYDRKTYSKKPVFATWVWDMGRIIAGKQHEALARFCTEHAVENVFVQVKVQKEGNGAFVVDDHGRVSKFIEYMTARGIAVHALYGEPALALKDNHRKVIDLVDAVCQYNASSGDKARFAGIHLDIEPYLLDEYKGINRDEVVVQYLDCLRKARLRMKKKDALLVLGVDIPFWFDKRYPDGVSQNFIAYRGQVKDVAKHVIDIADEVCVMAYRTEADGNDGAIEFAYDEVEYAGASGKCAYVALETFKDSEGAISDKISFSGKKRKDMSIVCNKLESAFSKEPGFAGIAIHHYETWRDILD